MGQIKFPSIQDEKAVVYTTYTFVKNYLLPSTFIYHHIMFAIVFICGCLLVLILACMYYIWQYMKQKMGTHKYFRKLFSYKETENGDDLTSHLPLRQEQTNIQIENIIFHDEPPPSYDEACSRKDQILS